MQRVLSFWKTRAPAELPAASCVCLTGRVSIDVHLQPESCWCGRNAFCGRSCTKSYTSRLKVCVCILLRSSNASSKRRRTCPLLTREHHVRPRAAPLRCDSLCTSPRPPTGHPTERAHTHPALARALQRAVFPCGTAVCRECWQRGFCSCFPSVLSRRGPQRTVQLPLACRVSASPRPAGGWRVGPFPRYRADSTARIGFYWSCACCPAGRTEIGRALAHSGTRRRAITKSTTSFHGGERPLWRRPTAGGAAVRARRQHGGHRTSPLWTETLPSPHWPPVRDPNAPSPPIGPQRRLCPTRRACPTHPGRCSSLPGSV